ncbi:hypothetical protein DDZ18_07925 [Marinicauda salina]|uniref:Uncharacterized protein n=1 Tax=Marinicauda salina TaxID=2135793 RepID=A0A2U2BU86_9PROT|nr:tetratricopeptide repeat protein [Marinicauda salina]PWE17586.1 hypothetical protein DDZ18_07925 [Marinicauda salina]
MRVSTARSLVVAALGFLAAACANSATVNVERAPRVLGAERIYSLAVMDFAGPGGTVLAEEIESEMVAARFRGQPAVSVVDPSSAGPRYARGRYRPARRGAAGLVEIGRRIDVDGVIGGSVLDEIVDDREYTREEDDCVARDEDGDCTEVRVVEIPCWDVDARIEARVLLVETATGRTLFNDIVRGESGMYYCEDEHLPYTIPQLRDQARRDAARPLRELFLPHEERVRAPFQRPGDNLPEPVAARFQAGYELAGDDRLGEACTIWEELETSGVRTAGLLYNLGVCAEVFGRLELALQRYEQALSLSPDEFRDARRARRRVITQMRDLDRLQGG